MQIIHQWQLPPSWHPLNPKLLDDNVLSQFKKIGVTSLQSYLSWKEVEKEKDEINFSAYDPLVEKLKQHNLKWTPFILLGQDYGTPKWFQDSSKSVYFKCLEHRKESKAQSIWNPYLPECIGRFLKMIADHYPDNSIFESILLGISGDWGEAIYSASGGYAKKINFHTHAGFWCNDIYAHRSFQEYIVKKYGSLSAVNQNWETNFTAMEDIIFPSFESKKATLKDLLFLLGRKTPECFKKYLRLVLKNYQRSAGEIRDFLDWDKLFIPLKIENEAGQTRWLDFIDWYFISMVNFSETWLKIARKYFPQADIYIVTGGNGAPSLGADFSAQTKVAAKYTAGVRITNHGDNYAENFVLSRLVASAAKFYGNYYSTEGANQNEGVVGRLYDAITANVKGLYYWALIGWGKDPYFNQKISPGKLMAGGKDLADNLRYIGNSQSIVKTGVFFPKKAIALKPEVLDIFYKKCVKLRDVLDFDFIDEQMIKDGALQKYENLLVLEGELPKGNNPSNIKITYSADEIKDKLDNEYDGVYLTQFPDSILAYNSTNSKRQKIVKSKTVDIEANSILKINI